MANEIRGILSEVVIEFALIKAVELSGVKGIVRWNVKSKEMSVDPAHGVELEAVLEAMQSDKKVAAGAVRWILLEGVGSPVLRDDIPPEAGRAAVESLLAG